VSTDFRAVAPFCIYMTGNNKFQWLSTK